MISKLWYILLIVVSVCFHLPSLKLNTIFNLLLCIVKTKSTLSNLLVQSKQPLNDFQTSIWIMIIKIIHVSNNLQYNVPYSNATPHPTQLTRQVDCHISFFLDWTLQLKITLSLYTRTFPIMILIMIALFLKLQQSSSSSSSSYNMLTSHYTKNATKIYNHMDAPPSPPND